jgi:hypothetical protein
MFLVKLPFQDRPSAARPGEIRPTVKGENMIIIHLFFELMLTESPWRKRWRTPSVFLLFFVALASTLAFPMWAEISTILLQNPFAGFMRLSAAATILTPGFMALRQRLPAENRNRT